MPFFRAAAPGRGFDRKAESFAARMAAPPADGDIDWLAKTATKGDADHAAWELRYARRALGVLAAQRDALDDLTASAVARAVTGAFATDPHIDPRMLDVAVQQFNARLSAYRDILQTRGGASQPIRLGQMLLAFAGGPIGRGQVEVARGGEIMAAYLAEASAALQETFGSPELPEDVPPSAMPRRG